MYSRHSQYKIIEIGMRWQKKKKKKRKKNTVYGDFVAEYKTYNMYIINIVKRYF